MTPGNVWAGVFDKTAAIHFDGHNWSPVALPANHPAWSLSIVSAADIWGAPNLHWDGNGWGDVPGAAATETVVSARGADAWAAGPAFQPGSPPTASHWNGSAWSAAMPLPTPAGKPAFATAVADIASSDAWVVGFTDESNSAAFADHWNGTAWSSVPVVTQGSQSKADAIRAVSASDIWIVGNYAGPGPTRGLTEHWDGTTWTQVANQAPGWLYAIGAASSSDVWAAGSDGANGDVLHWDGSTWTSVPVPAPATGAGQIAGFYGVSALSGPDVWAVGGDSIAAYSKHSLLYHYSCGAAAAAGASTSPSPVPGIPKAGLRVGAGQASVPVFVSIILLAAFGVAAWKQRMPRP